jgi:hypothetical protein
VTTSGRQSFRIVSPTFACAIFNSTGSVRTSMRILDTAAVIVVMSGAVVAAEEEEEDEDGASGVGDGAVVESVEPPALDRSWVDEDLERAWTGVDASVPTLSEPSVATVDAVVCVVCVVVCAGADGAVAPDESVAPIARMSTGSRHGCMSVVCGQRSAKKNKMK